MGTFGNRPSIEEIFHVFVRSFASNYNRLADQQCPVLKSKLPFIRQGIAPNLVYGERPFLVLSVDSKQPPFSFIAGHEILGTWDETEYPKLSRAACIDDIVEILELEQILYYKELDSLEPEYLSEALDPIAAQALAEQLLKDNLCTLQPTFEETVDRMVQAYGLLFRLENKLRNLIEKELKEKFGESDWWSKGATRKARERYEDRCHDARRRWHLLEDTSPLNFVDFEDLHDIIVNKNRDLFEQYIGPIDRFSVNMKSLEIPRNMIAHNNVLPSGEYYDFRRTVETLLRIIEPNLA
jgi:hypothetical protein